MSIDSAGNVSMFADILRKARETPGLVDLGQVSPLIRTMVSSLIRIFNFISLTRPGPCLVFSFLLLQGFPDFLGDEVARKQAAHVIESDAMHNQYTPPIGLQRLRTAVKNYYYAMYNATYCDKEEVTPLSSRAKQSLLSETMSISSTGSRKSHGRFVSVDRTARAQHKLRTPVSFGSAIKAA